MSPRCTPSGKRAAQHDGGSRCWRDDFTSGRIPAVFPIVAGAPRRARKSGTTVTPVRRGASSRHAPRAARWKTMSRRSRLVLRRSASGITFVAEFRRLVERRRADIGARRRERGAVEPRNRRAPSRMPAEGAPRASICPEPPASRRSTSPSPRRHEVASQHAVHHRRRGAQLRAPGRGRRGRASRARRAR